ncbi:MAG: PEP-CTERM sorting domain-containing protein [Fimbriimonadales bacterium]
MLLRQLSTLAAFTIPAMGLAQISVFDAAYRLEADARSGTSFDTHSSFSNSVGPAQTFFDQVDSFANDGASSVHSWANVSWNCTPTDLDAELVACWDSFDFGAGNSGHMLSRLFLGITLSAVNFVSTSATFDQPNSTAAIDMWNGSTWVQIVSPTQIQSYSALWNPGDYRLRAQRLYNPTGNSTGCPPFAFHLHAAPVPEPTSILAMGAGMAVLLRRRKASLAA